MPVVKTYGKHRTGIVKSHAWLTPDAHDENVFSSPEEVLEHVNVASPPSTESTERNAYMHLRVRDEPAAKQSKSRRAKPKTFSTFFNRSDESDCGDKENFAPSFGETSGVPRRRRNILQPPISFKINETNVTHRRNKSSSSSTENILPRKRTLSKVSRSSRKLRQNDGALFELGKQSTSSSSSGASSLWDASSISTGGTCSPGDQSCDLFDISEDVGSNEGSWQEELKTDSPAAKRARSVKDDHSRNKYTRGRTMLNRPLNKDTSTPVSAHLSTYSRKILSPCLFDTSLVNEDVVTERGVVPDSMFEDISRDMNELSIDLKTCKGELSRNTRGLSKYSSHSQKSLRSGGIPRRSKRKEAVQIEEGSIMEKISPCTIPLEKLQLPQFFTPPKNKQHSRLLESSFKYSLTPTRDKTSGRVITARTKVLCQCQQREQMPFSDILSESEISKCVKVGEGTYGEVFLTTNEKNESVALKIIPVEGDFKVNEEAQKTYEEILPEIVISRELSSMRTASVNQTMNFIEVNRVCCIQGAYPAYLLKQWDAYDKRKGSENDRPDLFNENQLFIMFEFANGGTDMEQFEFATIKEAVSILTQVTGTLASAECEYHFEHRDMHWGNVLVRKTKRTKVSFKVEGDTFNISSCGVEASIIDFTLSRLCKDECTVFCDLATDETIFTGKGDYQFIIYRNMKKENKNEWEAFNPHSNVLWLHYLLDKMLKSKTYATEPSKEIMQELKTFGRHLLSCSSAEQVLRESELVRLLEEL